MKSNKIYRSFAIFILIIISLPVLQYNSNQENDDLINKGLNLFKKQDVVNYTIFLDDFESYTNNTFPGGNYSLKLDGGDNSKQVITDTYFLNGSQSFTLLGTSTVSALAYRSIIYDSDNMRIDAFLMSETPTGSTTLEDKNMRVGFFNPDIAPYGEFYTSIGLKNDGNIILKGGASEIVLGVYSAYSWQHIILELNMTSNYVWAYVNNTLEGETTLTKNSSQTTAIGISSEKKNVRGYIDNLSLGYKVIKTAPSPPSDPSPTNNATDVSLNPVLSVLAYDEDGDSMDVSFYNGYDDTLIGTDMNVLSGNTASVSWPLRASGITYQWYAIADDGENQTRSSTWTFTTIDTATLIPVFEDDFESYDLSTLPAPYELKQDGQGESFQTITDAYSRSGSKSLTLLGSWGWRAVVSRPVYSNTVGLGLKNLVLEAYIMAETPSGGITGYSKNIHVGFWDPNSGLYGEYYTMIGLRNDGKITLEGGSSELVLGDYDPFVWYHVSLHWTLSNNSVDAYVNEELVVSTNITKNVTETVDIAIESGYYNIKGYIDDLKLYEKMDLGKIPGYNFYPTILMLFILILIFIIKKYKPHIHKGYYQKSLS
ncbi:MAG: hypothetical protein GF329_10155 [Candidatus Lokiarchaeota archaeon]|nr:hypothetical protein [Candidatus Lokiarchaeota archaeon]